MVLYYVSFYKIAFVHFLFTSLSTALFILGLRYSSGSDGDHDTPYYVPGIVLAVLHFGYLLWTLRIWMLSRGLLNVHKTLSANRLYVALLKLAFAWGVIGSILTGTSGICANENPCYYTVNKDKNLPVAISIILLHCFNNVFIFYVWCVKREHDVFDITRRDRKTVTSAQKKDVPIPQKLLNPPNGVTPGMPNYPRKGPPRLQRAHSDIKGGRIKLQPLPPLVHRRSNMVLQHDDQTSTSSSDSSNSHPPTMYSQTSGEIIKPLPPNRNKEKLSMMVKTIGKVNIWYKNSKSRQIDALPDNGDATNSTANDTNHQARKLKLKKRRSDDVMTKRPSRDSLPHFPPPAYHTIVTYNDQDAPYLTPGLPSDDYARQHNLQPGDIYTGTAYPDNVPVVAKPQSSRNTSRTVQL